MGKNLVRNELAQQAEATNICQRKISTGYLRISITDTCNMKCSYCHNEGQVEIKNQFMTLDQLRYIVTNALRFGLNKVRLTGGEPLLHPNCREMLHMLKKELAVPFVGFNTNGILINTLIPIVSEGLVDGIVLGLDYVDGDVSKDSTIGLSSNTILGHILILKQLGQDVSIACVYDGKYSRLELLVAWCLEHEVKVKILQVTDESIETEIRHDFISMTRRIMDRFSLKARFIAKVGDYCGMKDGSPRIYFFHSHCRLRECVLCGRIHMRVTADGFIKTCIKEDVKFPLLTGRFDESLLKAIGNLGDAPETRVIDSGNPCKQ